MTRILINKIKYLKMKKIILLAALIFAVHISAQTAYEKGMTKAFELWGQQKNTEAVQLFERIASAFIQTYTIIINRIIKIMPLLGFVFFRSRILLNLILFSSILLLLLFCCSQHFPFSRWSVKTLNFKTYF